MRGKGKQPIIFASGFGCDQTVWNHVSDSFEEDYQIILFDYVGLGKSDLSAFNSTKYSHLSGYVQDVLDICSTLEVKNAIFVGHSVSGMIGVLASLQKPEYFSDLIMIGPSPRYLNDPPEYYGGFEKQDLLDLVNMMEKNYIGWANMFSSTLLNTSDRKDVANELEDRFCSTDPAITQAFANACFFADNRKDLPLVTVPSHILQCSEDVIAPRNVGEYLIEHLPNSTISFMNAVGHCPHMTDPEETVSVIRAYLCGKTKNDRQYLGEPNNG
ncbi:alpha/beta hydrolase [Radiobacillus deserti]|uniref:Alpha/beta hydrolase n=1 Tax=Radiobacillus deserti TaxID=2594883 RepID=A0A516KLI4_9BACI|nr:alpha/beta hydrolase [Radiobacillus deserti]